MVQWLRLCTLNAGGMGSKHGQGTKIPHASLCVKKKKNLIKNKTQLSIIIANTYIGPTISQTLFRGKKIHLFT